MSGESVPSAAPPRAALLVVYLTVFLDLLGFGIILPLLPFYALKFGANGRELGLLFGAFSAAQFFGAFVIGRMSDRLGRRPVLLICLAGTALAFGATARAESLVQLTLARALAGLFSGSISTAQAYVADVTRPEERARYMGLVGASIGMGFVFGPWLGAELSRFGFRTSALASAGLAVLNFTFALVALRESLPRGMHQPSERRVSLAPDRLLGALGRPVAGRVLIAGALATLAFVSMESTFALLGKQRFDLGAQRLGRIFGLIGVTMALVQGLLVGRLARRLGERRLAMLGALLLAGALFVLPWMPSLRATVAVLLALAVGQGLLVPSLATLLSRDSSAHEQGGVLGIGQSLGSLARALGPPLAGTLFDQGAARPYVLATVLMLTVVVLILGARPAPTA
ncbi:MAG: MFS transporter [Polyangia bacterium]